MRLPLVDPRSPERELRHPIRDNFEIEAEEAEDSLWVSEKITRKKSVEKKNIFRGLPAERLACWRVAELVGSHGHEFLLGELAS